MIRAAAPTGAIAAQNFGAHALRPDTEGGRIKVTDHVIWINVVPFDGIPRRVAAFEGESLMEAINRHVIPGFHPECQGGDQDHTFAAHQVPYDYYSMGVGCGQCSVVIPDPHYDKLNKKPSTEDHTMGRMAQPYAENSRLACCIQVRKELNEMVCVIGNNKSNDGEWFQGRDP
eukprot:CAMPEP_0170481098 /NCGR_PEP_ID=MMETSP0208-20121228/1673_1 /TAXON_ID=197538 /ORGANISM="Strombidium inclinatum, Strain S3" /LENGTH=172 /DNA_ID=CAMNT_0010753743 /DNA_START=50 /DNA_END=565 /DNA_ORIENTATION=+